jgi:formylglycine-generating enzyme required for sulfatase activity
MRVASSSVFLSYSRNDLAPANTLSAALEQAGFEVFKDDTSIHGGDQWLTRLEEAVASCATFVVLVGRDGIRRYMGAEVRAALRRNYGPQGDAKRLPIFPLLLDDTPADALTTFLEDFQATRWSAADELPKDFLEELKAGISRLKSSEPFEGCPFLGLNAFGRKNAGLFFGRYAETLQALACLGDQTQRDPDRLSLTGGGAYHRWLQIDGNSGAGKSSLVQAGMLPVIERGALWPRTGFEEWTIIGPMMPGADPVDMLMAKLGEAFGVELGDIRRLWQAPGDEVLSDWLRTRTRDGLAFLLVIDQFEELFTFAEEASRTRFDALLAHALQSPACPLFVISTVRTDFLDRFELLPRLQAIYGSYCWRYPLATISTDGLREIIERPAEVAGLDVSEVKTAMVHEAQDEPGALPLVENALLVLWNQRQNGKLSGDAYRAAGGIAGMLSSQADKLLKRVEGKWGGKGRKAALELLLWLTRINDEGRHTRQRIGLDEAVMVAGGGDDDFGRQVIRVLAGERNANALVAASHGALRVVTVIEDPPRSKQFHVDLIHETLIRARKDPTSGEVHAYWPTLYDYISANSDRDLHRQQLKLQAKRWLESRRLGRWSALASWRDIARFHRLPLARASLERRYLAWSRAVATVEIGALTMTIAVVGLLVEGAIWVGTNRLPPIYIWQRQLWRLGLSKPLPEWVQIEPGPFLMGCQPGRDDVEGVKCGDYDRAHPVTLTRSYALGKTEVTVLQYAYYLWDKGHADDGRPLTYSPGVDWGRMDLPVTQVSWFGAGNYARWLSTKLAVGEGLVVRLPTEAEWEFAARAGSDTAYWWGPQFDPRHAICGVERNDIQPFGIDEQRKNPFGLQDMLGSVLEWVADADAQYSKGDNVDPLAAGAQNANRVKRGGSWHFDPRNCRAASRFIDRPDVRDFSLGFRVCRGAPIEPLSAPPLDIETPKR